MTMSFHAYILRCPDGSYYVGHTTTSINVSATIGTVESPFTPASDVPANSFGPPNSSLAKRR